MAKAKTHGGEFKTDAPGYYKVRDDNRGCDIKLVFTPEDPVMSPKIGLVQSVTTNKGGAAYNVGSDERKQEQANRSLSTVEEQEQGMGGRHIDRAAEKVNPVYGMANPTGGQKELGSSAETGNCHMGKRVMKNDKTFDTDAAWLTDGPSLNSAGVESAQVFETTALCLEGDMKGTYLGSVKWGYTKNASDVITLVDMAVVSMGAPTASWMLAAEKWNTTQTKVGGTDTDNLKLPTTTHETKNPTTKPQISRRLFELRGKLGGIDKNKDSTNYKNVDFEIKALEAKLKTL
ncbi:MAG: hypothetical protein U1F43_05460 [Myxococcota bacterium]